MLWEERKSLSCGLLSTFQLHICVTDCLGTPFMRIEESVELEESVEIEESVSSLTEKRNL